MYFANQADYMHYHSPEQRALRLQEATASRERAESEALSLFHSGDESAARQRLFDAGISDDGIAYYVQSWKS